jgi:hypothetical protein
VVKYNILWHLLERDGAGCPTSIPAISQLSGSLPTLSLPLCGG